MKIESNQRINEIQTEVETKNIYYTNHTSYKRIHDLVRNRIVWTSGGPYNQVLYSFYDGVWTIDRGKPTNIIAYNGYIAPTPYDGEIPDIEIEYQQALRKHKLKRILK